MTLPESAGWLPKVLKEEWAEYEVEDGTRIAMKLVLFKVLPPKADAAQPALNIAGNVQCVVRSPAENMGKSGATMTQEEINAAPKTQIGFKLIGEVPWNYYKVPDAPVQLRYIKLKVEAVNIYRVDNRWDADGIPI